MNKLCLTAFAFLALSLQTSPVIAQHPYDESYRANPKYEFMTREATRHQSDNFAFGLYRAHYKDTRQYDPLGDDIVDKMFELSYIVQNEKDQDKASKALNDYQALVLDHLANLRVVAQALSLSKLDRRFGNPDFFNWMLRGLIKEVHDSGNGESLSGAYDVITLSEETLLLGQLGVKPLGTRSAHEGYYYYNMHEVEDLSTGQKRTIFVNTTIPMRFLEAKKKKASKEINMPRQ